MAEIILGQNKPEDTEWLDPKVLADGNILVENKMKLLNEPSDQRLNNVLGLLRDSRIIFPMTMILSDADKKRMAEAEEKKETFSPQDELSFGPDTVSGKNGKTFVPIFSQTLQIPNDYYESVQFARISMLKAIQLAHSVAGAEGLVLDPFTQPLELPFKIADVIPTIPSSIKPAEKPEENK